MAANYWNVDGWLHVNDAYARFFWVECFIMAIGAGDFAYAAADARIDRRLFN